MPYHPDASRAPPTSRSPASGLHTVIRCDGDALCAIPRRRSCAIAPAVVRRRAIVQQLAPHRQPAHGRARWSTGASLALIAYPPRDGNAERMLMLGVDQLAEDAGVSPPQRQLWLRIHPEVGQAGDVAIVTWTRPDGEVSPHLAFRYPSGSWPLAVRLGQGLVLNDSESKEVPTRLGQLAGALGGDPRAIELELGPHEPPDVIVWVPIGLA
jgi:hypothetical protein